MKQVSEPIETDVGIISGRDAIFLDALKYEISNHSVNFKGELNSNLCSKADKNSENKKYRLEFRNVLYFEAIELDFFSPNPEYKSSFDEIDHSLKLQSMRTEDHSAKVTPAHKHYRLATYDDVFEIIASDYTLEIK